VKSTEQARNHDRLSRVGSAESSGDGPNDDDAHDLGVSSRELELIARR